MILLACALEMELKFWNRRDGVEVLSTGVGPVEAACAVTQALASGRYSRVVNAGIAGAFDGAARIGDGVVVAEDLMELGLEDGTAIALPNGEAVVDTAYSDPALVELLQRRGFAALRGLTVSRVTSIEATAQRLRALGAHVESMEGFAVLRAAQRAGISALEVRGISNRVGDRTTSGWSFEDGARGLARVLTAALE
ncbi:MAG: futalosine hydrolase [Candidatus Eremiobacteraeota bacterium]|nr:futalosine hydrolase [Candidatus Eremiobacteraeota bacterium]